MDIRSILSDHGIEDARNASTDVDLREVNQQITDLNQYVDGAFYDGIVTEIEAKKIQAQINAIKESNVKITEEYTAISNNPALLDGAIKDELFAAKANYDIAFSTLNADINLAISDGAATQEESEQVDASHLALTESLARLKRALESARDAILGKRTSDAEQSAKNYADGLKEDVTAITDDLDERMTSMEGYVDGTFRDGVVTEVEAKNIRSYIDSLNLQKTQLDNKYTEIYNNYFLSGTPKLNLSDAKTKYDEKHTSLIDIINNAIADNVATPAESDSVRQGFVELDTALSLLSSCFEKAIDSLSQARADEAEKLAKEGAAEYTDRKVGDIDTIIKNIVDDEIITQGERGPIKDDLTKIVGRLVLDTDLILPTIAEIDATMKGELYTVRKEALSAGLENTHVDYVALETAYNDLSTYLGTFTPKPWDVTTPGNIELDKSEWRTKWLDYYLGVAVLRERIAEITKNTRDDFAYRIETAESTIVKHSDEISLRVTKSVYEIDMDNVDKRISNAENKISYNCDVYSSNGYSFKNGQITSTIYAVVYRGTENVTDTLPVEAFIWKRISDDPAGDETWNAAHVNVGKSFPITIDDVHVRATFTCDVQVDVTTV